MASEGFAQPWVEFEEEFGERMLLTGDLTNCNDQFAKIGASMGAKYTFSAPDPAVRSEEKVIPGGLKVRVYTPENYIGNKPVGIYFHGGGWAMGDLDGDDAIVRGISKGGNVVIVSVEYGLAPQNKHPGLLNDCWKGLKWTLENSKSLGGVEGRLFTTGTSAGGQLALAMALKAIDEGLADSIIGVVALVPATVHPDAIPESLKAQYTSYGEHDLHTVNTASAMNTFWNAFGAPPGDSYTSPLLHSRIDRLKKVYLAVAGQDTLRDDGLLFKKKLDNAGVPNQLDLYEGYPHYHWMWPSPKLAKVREEFYANLAKGVQFVVS